MGNPKIRPPDLIIFFTDTHSSSSPSLRKSQHYSSNHTSNVLLCNSKAERSKSVFTVCLQVNCGLTVEITLMQTPPPETKYAVTDELMDRKCWNLTELFIELEFDRANSFFSYFKLTRLATLFQCRVLSVCGEFSRTSIRNVGNPKVRKRSMRKL